MATGTRIIYRAAWSLMALGLFAIWLGLISSLAAAESAYATDVSIERLDPRLDALIPRDSRVEVAADGIEWAEGPLWNREYHALLFSDVPRNGIYVMNDGGALTLFMARSGYSGEAPFTGREPGSNGLTFDATGHLVFCQHGNRQIVRREDDGRITVLADRYQGKRLNSPNDLVFRSNGDLYFTDPPFGLPASFKDPHKELPIQGVFRLSRARRLTVVVSDLDAPNGIGFSPDEKTLYVSNAVNSRPIWMAYPVRKDGTLGKGRQFAEASAYVKEGEGVPDGLKIDEHGNVYGAAPGGIHIFAPDGTRLGRIITGVPTGNLNWGGDGSVLYIAANHRILRLPTATRGAGWSKPRMGNG
jgi:gluconolactonase